MSLKSNRWFIFIAALITFNFSLDAYSANDETINSFYGEFIGGGRACTGNLKLTENSVLWKSSWSNCKKTKYKIIKKEFSKNESKVVLRLSQVSKKCLYPLIEIIQRDSEKSWELIGFQSEADFESKETAKALSCPVVKK